MEYRLVEAATASPDPLSELSVLRRYESAYHAADAIRRAAAAGDPRVERWYVLDEFDRVIFGPPDLDGLDELDGLDGLDPNGLAAA